MLQTPYSPANSTNHYVGIWYKKIPKRTVVWAANRDAPLTDTSGELTITLQGVLVLQDATTGNILWSSAKSSRRSVKNPIGQLLDTGKFIIYEEGDQENPIWQSFDFLTDTFLPEMKYGWNLVTGVEWHLTSWKSDNDPSSGNFSYGIDKRGYPQPILTDGPNILFRTGPWNGLRYTGLPNLRPNPVYNFTFVLNQREIYYRNELINTSVCMRLVLQPDGRMERFLWTDSKQEWNLYQALSSDNCDRYALCGPFRSCNIDNSQVCECLKGFEPRSPDQWRDGNWSQGCRRTIPLDCGLEEGFNKYSNLKLPDTQGSWYNQTMTLVDCEKMLTGSGCLLWFDELIDIRTFDENGDSLYIRMPPSELGKPKE
ncbi:putative non-specific serine/threonine protein kinase [Helianthus anomalus]